MPPNTQRNTPNADGVAESLSYAACTGIVVVREGVGLTHAPLTYWPSAVQRSCYEEALRITPTLNLLIHAISRDITFLSEALAQTAKADSGFTGRLLDLAQKFPVTGNIELSICRFDYFLQALHLRMVEMNTIAASFAALGARTANLHRHLALHPTAKVDYADQGITRENLPDASVTAPVQIAVAIAHAHHCYVDANSHISDAVVHPVVVVQPDERNTIDQDALRLELWNQHHIHMKRITLLQLADATIDDERCLRLPSGAYVSVAYLRAGYVPTDYPTNAEWVARARLEEANIPVCPSAAVQLTGSKKVQQVLDAPNVLERFVPDPSMAAAIRATFASQLSLDPSDNAEAHAKLAIDRPDDFVLKPQREGGGNNLYGNEMRDALLDMTPQQRSAYVLMERIRPTTTHNALIRDGQCTPTQVVSELGVYGIIVAHHGKVLLNDTAGTLLRSKSALKDDGGVAAGVAVLDSARLVD